MERDSSPFLRSLAIAALAWLVVAAAQTSLTVGLGRGTVTWWIVALLQVLHACLWITITLALRPLSRLLAGRARVPALAAHLSVLCCVAFVDAIVRRGLSELFIAPVTISFARTTLYYADVTTLSYVLALLTGKVIDAREALIAHTRHELGLRTQLARARLSYLHAQLQPHFLFNALGAVSELIFEDPAAAVRMFRQLGAILHAAASRSAPEIPLREEMEGLTPYLDVQRTRFADWLAITLDIDPAANGLNVPPLILQPLVENSIRHGLRGRSSRGEVSVSARVVNGRLHLTVRDNGVGLGTPDGRHRSGVGLSNTTERLRTLYGKDASLRLFNDELGGAVAEISMPVRPETSNAVEADSSPLPEIRTKSGFAARHPALALAGGCVLAAALWTQQSYAYLIMSGRLGNTTVRDLMRDDFASVAMWALLVPLVLWITRRIPASPGRWPVAVIGHVVAFVTAAAGHAMIVSLLRSGNTGDFLPMFRGTAGITLLLYVAVLAYGQRRLIEGWLAERNVASMRLNAEIAEAKTAAAAMTIDPESFGATLAEVEQYAKEQPLLAEQAVARLGAELRVALEAGSGAAFSGDSGGSGRSSAHGEDGIELLAVRA